MLVSLTTLKQLCKFTTRVLRGIIKVYFNLTSSHMDTTNIAILQDTLKYLQVEWQNNGIIEIYFCVIGNIHVWDNTIESLACYKYRMG